MRSAYWYWHGLRSGFDHGMGPYKRTYSTSVMARVAQDPFERGFGRGYRAAEYLFDMTQQK